MTAGAHYPCDFAEARARIGDVLDHLKAARNIKTRILERQLFGVGDTILYPSRLYPSRVGVESPCMRDVALVEVTGNEPPCMSGEIMVQVSFAAADIDYAFDLDNAPDRIQRLVHPALARPISRQKKLVVHLPFILTTGSCTKRK